MAISAPFAANNSHVKISETAHRSLGASFSHFGPLAVDHNIYTYGSDSPGREFCPKYGPFWKKVEPSYDHT